MFKKVMLVILVALPLLLPGSNLWADNDAIMDVDDNAAVFTGTWPRSTYRILYYGDDYQYAVGSGGAATATATFTTREVADITGTYNVYVRWTAGTARAPNARYRIYDGSTYRGDCTFDQRLNGGAWQFCRAVELTRSRRGVVILDNANVPTNRYVCADAVRFVRQTWDKDNIMDEPGVDWSSTSIVPISSTSTGSPALLRSQTITCPGSGTQYVVATGSTYVALYSGSIVPGDARVRTSLSSNSSYSFETEGFFGLQNVTPANTFLGYGTISKSHVFTCTGGSSLTVRFFASTDGSAGVSTFAGDISLVLTVYPTRY